MMLFEEHGLFPSGEQFFFSFLYFFLLLLCIFSLYYFPFLLIFLYTHHDHIPFSLVHTQLHFTFLSHHSPAIAISLLSFTFPFYITYTLLSCHRFLYPQSVTFFLDPYTLPYIAIKLVFIILQCKKFSSIFIQDHKCFFINVIIYKVFICKKLLFHTVFVPYRINV